MSKKDDTLKELLARLDVIQRGPNDPAEAVGDPRAAGVFYAFAMYRSSINIEEDCLAYWQDVSESLRSIEPPPNSDERTGVHHVEDLVDETQQALSELCDLESRLMNVKESFYAALERTREVIRGQTVPKDRPFHASAILRDCAHQIRLLTIRLLGKERNFDRIWSQLPGIEGSTEAHLVNRDYNLNFLRSDRGTPSGKPVPTREICLRSLRRFARQLEIRLQRSSRATEEEYRDYLAAHLNAAFSPDGLRAEAEVKRGNGKTDLFVTADNRLILVVECKIWKGKKYIQEGLDQLLGNSARRDDSELALFVLNPPGASSGSTRKLLRAVETHKGFRSYAIEGPWQDEDGVWEFFIECLGDAERVHRVTLMVFDLFGH